MNDTRPYAWAALAAVAAIATPVAAQADGSRVEGLRHTRADLARNAVRPRAVTVVSVPDELPVGPDALDPRAVWVDDGMSIEEALAELGLVEGDLQTELSEALAQVRFRAGKARVKHRWHPYLDHMARLLRENPGTRIELIGHTDDSGAPALNIWLSKKRARRVRQQLERRGISADRVVVAGAGANSPAMEGTTAEARAANRRVEIRVVE